MLPVKSYLVDAYLLLFRSLHCYLTIELNFKVWQHYFFDRICKQINIQLITLWSSDDRSETPTSVKYKNLYQNINSTCVSYFQI